MLRRLVYALIVLVVLAAGGFYALGRGAFGNHEPAGEVTAVALPPGALAQRAAEREAAAAALGQAEKQILFGDLHVHTTFSSDAFVMSLPLVSGEGAHPPADACDFARFCSALDFWSINDHAESLTPEHWRETVDSIRQCNAVTTPEDPDVTAFLGWEWTQDGATAKNHFGHKNILLKDLDEARVPTRPIASIYPDGGDIVAMPPIARAGLALLIHDRRTLDFTRFLEETSTVPPCPTGVPVRELPDSCKESARTPGELFAKLDEWGVESIVIPHGTTWGNTSPPGSTWDSQIGPANDDPKRQTLVEIYSGHGNSEEYRDFLDVELDANGNEICPPTLPGPSGYLPNCRRAGEIIRDRCLAAGESEDECQTRAALARANHVAGGKTGFRTVPGTAVEDWLDAGQCRDCFLPAFDYRPRMSAQYMLVRKNFEGEVPVATRMGFIASSDNHTARPGTGYKEVDRSEMTEGKGPRADAPDLLNNQNPPVPYSVALDEQPEVPFATRDVERMSSFFTTGGLVAVHSAGRGRDAIWQGLKQREVYGTSGDRILLWFDLLSAQGGALPMGSEVTLSETPRFRVRAVGALEQNPGCPEFVTAALSEERLHDLCRNECYHPADERKRITRIEVVRMRPQLHDDEPVGGLIEDPWQTLPCDGGAAGCVAEFDDQEFVATGRDTIYYVRAIQEPSPAVNGKNLRCSYDGDGNCIALDPCHGEDAKTDYEDDCLSDIEERAWSSPIWVDQPTRVGAIPAPS
ncbi:MAG: DUF3604 domain-containing protein [Candidatus Binatia bacterium]|nr:DUF3604 domain-containing protein [Candidatus Binatia bacterium]